MVITSTRYSSLFLERMNSSDRCSKLIWKSKRHGRMCSYPQLLYGPHDLSPCGTTSERPHRYKYWLVNSILLQVLVFIAGLWVLPSSNSISIFVLTEKIILNECFNDINKIPHLKDKMTIQGCHPWHVFNGHEKCLSLASHLFTKSNVQKSQRCKKDISRDSFKIILRTHVF